MVLSRLETASAGTARSGKDNFELSIDPLGIAICRIRGPIDEAGAEALASALAAMIAAARRSGSFRLLFDNRCGASFASADQAAIRALRQSACTPDDRIATLVSTSLEKIEVRKNREGTYEAFLSESAALTWLNAWG